ncbi:unnamed protein product [Medioppia subpectinata]|uniref:Cytochrome P450 n=1 Tax=Medioppia subpectinata TaxID=1979941 RepID=A0A7R9QEX7_9ACAR|nr:unnamed protein product [Medioppia subpectinata]CAG2119613.1 unnamed protein product [Medioppia subpectinata]
MKSHANTDKSFGYDILYDWLGKGLLINTSTDLWRQRRRLIAPAFHRQTLDNFLPVFNDLSRVFEQRLHRSLEKESINICDLIFSLSLDIIAETGMGIKLNAQGNEHRDYIDAIQHIGKIMEYRFLNPLLWPDCTFKLSETGKQFKQCYNISHSLTHRVISDRKRVMIESKGFHGSDASDGHNEGKAGKRLAFLDLLLAHHLSNNNSLSLEDIREEVDTFMFAGHDTTACCLSWTIFFLGLYPEIQGRIHEELDEIFDNNCDINAENINKLRYLEAVIKESLRLRSPVPTIMRTLTQDIQLGPYTIPSGVSILLLLDELHHDPDIYPKPLKFNPDRWLSSEHGGNKAASFMPFSLGARDCIGQRFAMNELKVVLGRVLHRYAFRSLEPIDKVIEYHAMVKKPKYGIRVKVTQRVK